ncbi:oligosaccharide flippase family protein [Patescibacteria group bacterium]
MKILSLMNIPIKILGRLLGTDAEYLLYGSFWFTVAKIVNTVVAFLLSVAYAHYISKNTYGDYRYILSIFGMLAILSLPGMRNAITRSVARGFYGTFRKCAPVVFLFSIGITVVGACVGLYFFYQENYILGWGMIIASLGMPFVEGLAVWRAFLHGTKQFKKRAYFNIPSHIFYGVIMLITILFIFYLQLDRLHSIVALVSAYAIGRSLPNIILFLKTYKKIPKDAPCEHGAMKYGFHLSLAAIPTTIAYYFDGVLLYILLGPASLAVYSFAIAIPEQLKAYVASIAEVAFPKLSEKTHNKEKIAALKKTLLPKIMKATLFTVLMVIIYIIAAPFIYNTFFPKYTDAIIFSQIFSLSLLFLPLSVLDKEMRAEGNLKYVYLYDSVSPLLQIGILAVLIPFFGLWGAVTGRVLGRLINYLFLIIIFKR